MNTSFTDDIAFEATIAEIFQKADASWAIGEIKPDLLRIIMVIDAARQFQALQTAFLNGISLSKSGIYWKKLGHEVKKFMGSEHNIVKHTRILVRVVSMRSKIWAPSL